MSECNLMSFTSASFRTTLQLRMMISLCSDCDILKNTGNSISINRFDDGLYDPYVVDEIGK
jgi:hypothetical protein